MSGWTPIQFVPLECTAIRLHQIFKEWPLYFGETTASVFFSFSLFLLALICAFSSVSSSRDASRPHYFYNREYKKLLLFFLQIASFTHTHDMTTLDHAWLRLASRCCFQRYQLQTFLFDHLDELTGSAGENPSTDKATRILRCFSEGHGLSARRRGKLNISFSR